MEAEDGSAQARYAQKTLLAQARAEYRKAKGGAGRRQGRSRVRVAYAERRAGNAEVL
jgi:hypothetical protein